MTSTSAVITWMTRSRWLGPIPRPMATDTQLWCGPADGAMTLVHDDPTPTVVHRVVVTDLEPGRTYRFHASSSGIKARPTLLPTRSASSPERTTCFTTLVPPQGRYLTTIALTNDIHIGEKRQGIVLGPLPTSVVPGPSHLNYPEIMLGATMDELDRMGHPLLLVNGDVTYANKPDEVLTARTMLDGYGQQNRDWLATRGNHDHPGPFEDPFGEVFVGYQQAQVLSHPCGLRILGVDSTKGPGGGWITEAQYEQIRSELSGDPDRPTLVLSHHPVTHHAAWTSPSGPSFMLRARDRVRLQALEQAADGVFAHATGHTHRMHINRPDVGDRVHHWENASCAAYPAGYTLVHLYSDGFVVNFHRPTTESAQEWLFRSRWQSLSIGAHIMLGSVHDRNHVVAADLSGLVPAPLAGD